MIHIHDLKRGQAPLTTALGRTVAPSRFARASIARKRLMTQKVILSSKSTSRPTAILGDLKTAGMAILVALEYAGTELIVSIFPVILAHGVTGSIRIARVHVASLAFVKLPEVLASIGCAPYDPVRRRSRHEIYRAQGQ